MTFGEVAIMFNEIKTFYPNQFIHDEPMLAMQNWHRVLKDFDNEKVKKNLDAHVLNSKYPPKIVDLTDNAKIYVRPKPFVMDFEEGEDWPL